MIEEPALFGWLRGSCEIMAWKLGTTSLLYRWTWNKKPSSGSNRLVGRSRHPFSSLKSPFSSRWVLSHSSSSGCSASSVCEDVASRKSQVGNHRLSIRPTSVFYYCDCSLKPPRSVVVNHRVCLQGFLRTSFGSIPRKETAVGISDIILLHCQFSALGVSIDFATV